MARKKTTPKPPAPPPSLSYNPHARRLANAVRQAHGEGSADTLDRSEDIGAPRLWMAWGNIAFQRVVSNRFPLGRMVEFTGDENVGKSTAVDQLLAQVQTYAGGLGVLADVERAREREYMASLGIDPKGLIWIQAKTAEAIFDEIETIARLAVHHSNRAWVDALARAGVKIKDVPTEVYEVYDPSTAGKRNRKPTARWSLVRWTAACRTALLQYQRDNGLPASGIRDEATAAKLRPVVVHPPPPDSDYDADQWTADALYHWENGVSDPRCQPADSPIVLGWDSVGMTCTEAELQGSARDVHPASAARVISQNARRLAQFMDDAAISLVFCNQEYSIIEFGGPPGKRQGGKTTQYGGKKLKHAKSIHLHLTRGRDIYRSTRAKEDGEPAIGHEVYVYGAKNRFGPRGRRAMFGLIYHRGAVDAYTIFMDLRDRGIIRTAGAWSTFVDPTVLPSCGLDHKSWQNTWAGFEDLCNDNPQLNERCRQLYLEGY